jgi:tetratricopeptide (TPR) repeat protein
VEEYLERGQVFAERKDYQRAVAEYDQAIALDPACLDAYLKRGDANMNLWNYDLAIADYNRVIERAGPHTDAYLKRGGVYQANGQLQQAWDDYVTALRIDPEFVAAYSACASLLIAVGDYQAAVEMFTLAISIAPQNPGLLTGRALANMNLGDTDAVLADCRLIREQFPDQDIMAYMYEAQVYLYQEDYARAVEVLEQGIGRIPQGALNAIPLIVTALNAGGLSETDAIAEVKRMVGEFPAADPQQADFRDYLLAMIGAVDPGLDFDRSIAEQRQKIAARETPGIMPYFSLLVYYLGREDIDGAVNEMNTAIQRNPQNPAPYAMRAFVSFLQTMSELAEETREQRIALFRDKSDNVIADCDTAISLGGTMAGVYQIRGLTKQLSVLPGAEDDLSEAIRLKPDEKENWYARGWSYFDSGNYSAALNDFIQALNIDSNFSEAQYGFARSCAILGDHRRAVNFYTKYLAGNADDIDALYYRGESLSSLGEAAAAAEDFAKARELNTDDREIRASLPLQVGFNVSF